jgi:hypothetical protein
VVETANRKVALIASAVVIAFLAAIALRTLLT